MSKPYQPTTAVRRLADGTTVVTVVKSVTPAGYHDPFEPESEPAAVPAPVPTDPVKPQKQSKVVSSGRSVKPGLWTRLLSWLSSLFNRGNFEAPVSSGGATSFQDPSNPSGAVYDDVDYAPPQQPADQARSQAQAKRRAATSPQTRRRSPKPATAKTPWSLVRGIQRLLGLKPRKAKLKKESAFRAKASVIPAAEMATVVVPADAVAATAAATAPTAVQVEVVSPPATAAATTTVSSIAQTASTAVSAEAAPAATVVRGSAKPQKRRAAKTARTVSAVSKKSSATAAVVTEATAAATAATAATAVQVDVAPPPAAVATVSSTAQIANAVASRSAGLGRANDSGISSGGDDSSLSSWEDLAALPKPAGVHQPTPLGTSVVVNQKSDENSFASRLLHYLLYSQGGVRISFERVVREMLRLHRIGFLKPALFEVDYCPEAPKAIRGIDVLFIASDSINFPCREKRGWLAGLFLEGPSMEEIALGMAELFALLDHLTEADHFLQYATSLSQQRFGGEMYARVVELMSTVNVSDLMNDYAGDNVMAQRAAQGLRL